jgi:hypothetical protein
MSDGPYGRHGFNANQGGYGGGASYSQPAGGAPAGGYAAPSYGGGGESYGGGASYSAPTPQGGAYGSQYGAYSGTPDAYQVGSYLSCAFEDIIVGLDRSVSWHERFDVTGNSLFKRVPCDSVSFPRRNDTEF